MEYVILDTRHSFLRFHASEYENLPKFHRIPQICICTHIRTFSNLILYYIHFAYKTGNCLLNIIVYTLQYSLALGCKLFSFIYFAQFKKCPLYYFDKINYYIKLLYIIFFYCECIKIIIFPNHK